MTEPMAQAIAAGLPRWGVWDEHEQRWAVGDLLSEREAWQALLDVDSIHPWELAVKKQPGELPTTEKCKTCDGDGECFNCGHECRDCDGTGEVER